MTTLQIGLLAMVFLVVVMLVFGVGALVQTHLAPKYVQPRSTTLGPPASTARFKILALTIKQPTDF